MMELFHLPPERSRFILGKTALSVEPALHELPRQKLMKIHIVSFVTVWLLAWGIALAPAQELPQPSELPPPELPAPKPATEKPLPLLPADCHHGPPSMNVVTGAEAVPVNVLVPREVVTIIKRPALEVVYRDQKVSVTEMVYKPVEVLREVPCAVTKPCEEVDPHTGKVCVVMKTFTETRLQKETVFTAVPETREVIIQVPFLKEVEELIPQRNILLEYHQETVLRPFAIGFPGPPLPQDRYFHAPPPPCAVPGCAANGCAHP
jgi:hypothetical protein